MRLADLVIAGVNKGGTTSLFAYLSRHPEIGASAVKETEYFLPLRYGQSLPPIHEYAAHFAHVHDARVVLEATPGYFYGGVDIACAIRKLLHNARIILLFRDPVDRLISFYRSMTTLLKLERSVTLNEYVRRCSIRSGAELRSEANNTYFGLEGGHYSAYFPAWVETFGPNLRTYFYDDLRSTPLRVLDDIVEWLRLDSAPLHDQNLEVENRTVDFKHRWLHGLALTTNSYSERVLRSRPAMKRILRSIYYAVNGAVGWTPAPTDVRDELVKHYQPWNEEFAGQLRACGHEHLPGWLTS